MRRLLYILVGMFIASLANGQPYPSKPVKPLVGFAAGGPTDVIARILAQDMSSTR